MSGSHITRREALYSIAGGVCVPPVERLLKGWKSGFTVETEAEAGNPGWTSAWDHALLSALLRQMDEKYDATAKMTTAYRGPEYNYQSNIRSQIVHPIRDALEYALLLLESGTEASRDRACSVLDRVLSLQETDIASKWFGLWSYYLEEPLDKMSTVDFNWADFNGSILLLILLRHSRQLPSTLVPRMGSAIRNAAASIQKRDITPYYTNIMAQGSFVILAAAEMFNDPGLLSYGLNRLKRWGASVDECGSFAEYNSPAYTPFTIENLTRIAMYIHHPQALEIGERLHRRAWQEMSVHWHAPTMQLAGPMARAYSNDIGSPLWLQKGTNNQAFFLDREQIAERGGGGVGAGIVAFHCPEDLRAPFVHLERRHQHREVFVAGSVLLDTLVAQRAPQELVPVEGTTLLGPSFALGTANRSDFWNQRRPMLAYWGGRERPSRCMQLRVIKDDYDFSSATFYSVQENGCVLAAVGFRNDGGDKHPLIDRLQGGAFSMQRMYMQFLFANWEPGWTVLADDHEVTDARRDLPATTRIAIDVGACKIGIHVRRGEFEIDDPAFPKFVPMVKWNRFKDKATLDLILYHAPQQQVLRWSAVRNAGCVFTYVMDDSSLSLRDFHSALATAAFSGKENSGKQSYIWHPTSSSMELTVRTGVESFAVMESGYRAAIDGRAVPLELLSNQPILMPHPN